MYFFCPTDNDRVSLAAQDAQLGFFYGLRQEGRRWKGNDITKCVALNSRDLH